MANINDLPKPVKQLLDDLHAKANNTTKKEIDQLARTILATMVPVDSPGEMKVESGVSQSDRQPFVSVTWGAQRGLLTVIQARQYALQIFETTEAAVQDAALIEASTAMGLGDDTGFRLVQAVREHRDKFER